jgi:sialate O-acetylesterase
MWLDFGAEDTFRWPMTRLAQASVRDTLRNTGMVCLLDQGEYGNIHPTCKRPVGERLAEMAEHVLRGAGEVSPRAVRKYTEGNTAIVQMTAPVVTRDGKAPRLLEAAGEDGRYVPACALAAGDTLRVWAAEVEHPVYVRYAWTDWSDQVNLFGENGLPLAPFWLK